MAMQEVAVYLRALRRTQAMSQEALAEAVGVSKRTIERFERAEGDITAFTFIRIVAVLQPAFNDVQQLALGPAVSEDTAHRLAHRWAHPAGGGGLPHIRRTPEVAQALETIHQWSPQQQIELIIAVGEALHITYPAVPSAPPAADA